MESTVTHHAKSGRILLWFCVVGVAIHCLFWVLLAPLAQARAHRILERLAVDSYASAGYEEWEPEWNKALMIMGVPLFICLPAGVTAIIAALLPVSRKKRKRVAIKTLGISLGVLSLLYMFWWTTG